MLLQPADYKKLSTRNNRTGFDLFISRVMTRRCHSLQQSCLSLSNFRCDNIINMIHVSHYGTPTLASFLPLQNAAVLAPTPFHLPAVYNMLWTVYTSLYCGWINDDSGIEAFDASVWWATNDLLSFVIVGHPKRLLSPKRWNESVLVLCHRIVLASMSWCFGWVCPLRSSRRTSKINGMGHLVYVCLPYSVVSWQSLYVIDVGFAVNWERMLKKVPENSDRFSSMSRSLSVDSSSSSFLLFLMRKIRLPLQVPGVSISHRFFCYWSQGPTIAKSHRGLIPSTTTEIILIVTPRSISERTNIALPPYFLFSFVMEKSPLYRFWGVQRLHGHCHIPYALFVTTIFLVVSSCHMIRLLGHRHCWEAHFLCIVVCVCSSSLFLSCGLFPKRTLLAAYCESWCRCLS